MQCVAALKEELLLLKDQVDCSNVIIVPSSESWNPIAAVVIKSLMMPATIIPSKVDIRIPVPNLYAFAVSCNAGFIWTELRECINESPVPVPFCTPVDTKILDIQQPYYVDVRENRSALLGSFSICVTPEVTSHRFAHTPLQDLVRHLLGYLESPTAAVRMEIEKSQEVLRRNDCGPSTLLRLAHLYEGIREYAAALTVVEEGLRMYPAAPWLLRKHRHLKIILDPHGLR